MAVSEVVGKLCRLTFSIENLVSKINMLSDIIPAGTMEIKNPGSGLVFGKWAIPAYVVLLDFRIST